MNAFSIVLMIFGTASSLPDQNTPHSDLQSGATPTPSLKDRHLDLIIESLNRTTWREEDSACYTQLLLLLQNVKNNTLWATWIWDSIQFPTGTMSGTRAQLGSYDACMSAPWRPPQHLRTRYCLAYLRLARPPYDHPQLDPYCSTNKYFHKTRQHTRKHNELFWGVCVPGECGPGAVTTLVTSLLATTHLAPMSPNVKITYVDCQDSNEGSINYVFIYVVIVLSLICVISTVLVKFYQDSKKSSLLMDIAKCFCILRNTTSLTSGFKSEIKCLNGLRFLSAYAIVLFHLYCFRTNFILRNGTRIEKIVDSPLGMAYSQLKLAVDTFFLMSGLLFVRSNISRGISNPLLLIIKRYCRLIFPLSLVILFITTMYFETGDGPYWSTIPFKPMHCYKYWWMDFAVVSNCFFDRICYFVSWYISCDLQLSVIGVILFLIWQKHKIIGYVIIVLVTIAAILTPGFISMVYYQPGQMFEPFNAEYLDYTVQGRVSSYLLGMATGFLIRLEERKNYARGKKCKLSKINSLLISALALAILGVILVWEGEFMYSTHSTLSASVYVILFKVMWAVAVIALIICCQYGDVPIVNHILSWRPFVPLGRLSYGIYLVHSLIIFNSIFTARTPQDTSNLQMLVESVGVVMLSSAASWALWLLVEAPVGRLCQLQYYNPVPAKSQIPT